MITVESRPLALMGCGQEGHKLYYRLMQEGIRIEYVVDNKRTESILGKWLIDYMK